jgi:hypothetical protein
MMPYEPIRDVMRRTIENLNFVEAHKSQRGPYEVTQLLNSFLGALCHPWEACRIDLNAKSLSEAVSEGWPAIAKERPRDCEPQSLGDLIRLMRNAIAHGNIEFLPGSVGEIRALRIWNMERDRRNWGALISVSDMRSFLHRFVAIAEELCSQEAERHRSA